ncbi:PD-(D/E)XK nuclease family protein [Myxococcota bacterium]|nr:PD-(D/E)XK nuclease family protein [Myxococcota bacterium]MCZ7617985.1 PD-(D/E)XK nuclease family protein [Myxococcota bacterium]
MLLATGPRAAEAQLLEEVARAARAGEAALRRGELAALRRPLRIVVPSQSLRRHVAARLVAHAGGSLLGVQVQTHVALALEALGRAGLAVPRGSALVPVLVRRHAAEEPALARWLGDLEDGYGIVDGAVRDLLDAGFEAASAEAFEEAIAAVQAEDEVSATAVARAQALGRIALQVLAALEAADLGHRTALLARARAALHAPGAHPDALLPTAGLWIHGFADATGLVVEWLEALVRAFAARVLVDGPEDPALPGRRETRYAKDFCDRLRDATRGEQVVVSPPAVAPPAALELLRAPGAAAELRAVAARIRARLDAGEAPESIGIVAPRFETHRAALAAQLGRLGIPFSTEGVPAGPDAVTRRIAALTLLLRSGGSAPAETWLAAAADPDAADPDLHVALHVLGAGRLGQVATLDLDAVLGDASALRLPVRRGGVVGSAGADDTAARNRRRRISRRRLEQARTRAASLLRSLHDWPEQAPFSIHLAALQALLHERLGWGDDDPEQQPALTALDALAHDVPPEFGLMREEMQRLVVDTLEAVSAAPAGGAGAGVQVLSFTAARARTFGRLFVLGLNRGEFPQAGGEDPVLPDALRARIRRDVLSEMPVKERLRDEERAVFASLCAAAPNVVLSWQSVSDDGRTRVESPFLTRLRVAHTSRELPETFAAPLFAADCSSDPAVVDSPRPAHEHAVLAGLAGLAGAGSAPSTPAEASDFESVYAVALAEVRAALRADSGPSDPAPDAHEIAALARFRAKALRLLEAGGSARGDRDDDGVPSLGPWFGWVGAPAPDAPSAEPTADVAAEISVTQLEGLARCPWQHFLRRELGLEPVPDALAELPAPASRLRGRVIDQVLRRIVDAALPAPRQQLEAALASGPVCAPWPAPDVLERWLLDAARTVAAEDGLVLPGFAAALARRVSPLLAVAQAADWHDPSGPSVLGAELSAELVLPDAAGLPRRIGFRADRADLSADGVLRITDYKAGAPISSAARADTRQRHLLAAIRRGEKLQAVIYHVAGRALAPGRAVEGRYLFLAEKLADAARSLTVTNDAHGANAVDALHETVPKLFAVADHGVFVPRLDTPEGRPPCSWCDVVAACLRGEHRHRTQLGAWMEAAGARAPEDLTPAERAALAVLRLPSESEAAGRDERRTDGPGVDA